jgi:hypothetical protein
VSADIWAGVSCVSPADKVLMKALRVAGAGTGVEGVETVALLELGSEVESETLLALRLSPNGTY